MRVVFVLRGFRQPHAARRLVSHYFSINLNFLTMTWLVHLTTGQVSYSTSTGNCCTLDDRHGHRPLFTALESRDNMNAILLGDPTVSHVRSGNCRP